MIPILISIPIPIPMISDDGIGLLMAAVAIAPFVRKLRSAAYSYSRFNVNAYGGQVFIDTFRIHKSDLGQLRDALALPLTIRVPRARGRHTTSLAVAGAAVHFPGANDTWLHICLFGPNFWAGGTRIVKGVQIHDPVVVVCVAPIGGRRWLHGLVTRVPRHFCKVPLAHTALGQCNRNGG